MRCQCIREMGSLEECALRISSAGPMLATVGVGSWDAAVSRICDVSESENVGSGRDS